MLNLEISEDFMEVLSSLCEDDLGAPGDFLVKHHPIMITRENYHLLNLLYKGVRDEGIERLFFLNQKKNGNIDEFDCGIKIAIQDVFEIGIRYLAKKHISGMEKLEGGEGKIYDSETGETIADVSYCVWLFDFKSERQLWTGYVEILNEYKLVEDYCQRGHRIQVKLELEDGRSGIAALFKDNYEDDYTEERIRLLDMPSP